MGLREAYAPECGQDEWGERPFRYGDPMRWTQGLPVERWEDIVQLRASRDAESKRKARLRKKEG